MPVAGLILMPHSVKVVLMNRFFHLVVTAIDQHILAGESQEAVSTHFHLMGPGHVGCVTISFCVGGRVQIHGIVGAAVGLTGQIVAGMGHQHPIPGVQLLICRSVSGNDSHVQLIGPVIPVGGIIALPAVAETQRTVGIVILGIGAKPECFGKFFIPIFRYLVAVIELIRVEQGAGLCIVVSILKHNVQIGMVGAVGNALPEFRRCSVGRILARNTVDQNTIGIGICTSTGIVALLGGEQLDLLRRRGRCRHDLLHLVVAAIHQHICTGQNQVSLLVQSGGGGPGHSFIGAVKVDLIGGIPAALSVKATVVAAVIADLDLVAGLEGAVAQSLDIGTESPVFPEGAEGSLPAEADVQGTIGIGAALIVGGEAEAVAGGIPTVQSAFHGLVGIELVGIAQITGVDITLALLKHNVEALERIAPELIGCHVGGIALHFFYQDPVRIGCGSGTGIVPVCDCTGHLSGHDTIGDVLADLCLCLYRYRLFQGHCRERRCHRTHHRQ